MKIKVGIIFGGQSREREISFAGGRTVYDNLDKSLFEPVPVFVDSFGLFIKLNWKYIYKGSIRDFYPPVETLPESPNGFQVYAESLFEEPDENYRSSIAHIGEIISAGQLKKCMDVAFLCLHGPHGEDGKIQGLLDYYSIPYTGSGILPSAIGIDKAVQKKWMEKAGFPVPEYVVIEKQEWLVKGAVEFWPLCRKKVGIPMVIKSASQGSSIGITILKDEMESAFEAAVNKAFFIEHIDYGNWIGKNDDARVEWVRQISDIREGLGLPLYGGNRLIYHPEELLQYLNQELSSPGKVTLTSVENEGRVIVEAFIKGREFSCIVIENENAPEGTKRILALPPTEIVKNYDLFDYRSKYLPGLANKVTPIDIPAEQIGQIASACENLFTYFGFNVYARIDGFLSSTGIIYLNDPNTTSGMMPSSFFFHQAAEIGLNPSRFLTYIIRTSLKCRSEASGFYHTAGKLMHVLDGEINKHNTRDIRKTKVGIILGGYSSERHISVESGRNIYEKLSSSEKYSPVPVFLSGTPLSYTFHQLPINMLLKDNADDISEKIKHFSVHPYIGFVRQSARGITEKYTSGAYTEIPVPMEVSDMKKDFDAVFIALHGRPGEDGALQTELEKYNIPYNGSGVRSSQITINKFVTNEILKTNGFHVAAHSVVTFTEWQKDKEACAERLIQDLKLPLIAKPVDDGCSSAVKKIKSKAELLSFGNLIFNPRAEWRKEDIALMKIKPNEEFPQKEEFLAEELISRKDALHFLEITGGLLTHLNEDGSISYEVFEASEALSEGEVLSLEEKFLAGQGQNITPARYSNKKEQTAAISKKVKQELERAAKVLDIKGYARIDAFVRIYPANEVEVIFIEVNSLPGMTPATCIFHQSALNGYKPYDFIDKIIEFGRLSKTTGK